MTPIVHNRARIFDVCDRVNLPRNGRVEYDEPVAGYRKARQENTGDGRG